MAMRKPYELTVKQASRAIARKELSPVELVKSCLERIEALDNRLLAWALVDAEGALRSARRLERELKDGKKRSPLHGIPIGIKDIFYTKGLRTEAGSRTMVGFVPTYDATVISRLKEAGAIILGKTHTTEFASFDPAPTKNPWNLEHTPGGSSSGSAAGVAALMCPAALGSQTGGSTLRPAAFNGIVGLKGEHGRISTYGVIPLSWTMDHVGILARSVYDAAMVLQVIAGFDANDPRSLNAPVPNFLSGIGRQKAPHLGLAKDFFFDNADNEMKRATLDAARKLGKAGAKVDEVKLPQDFKLGAEINRIIMGVEAAAYHEKVFIEKKNLYRPNIRNLIEQGLETSSTIYSRAIQTRFEQRSKVTPILKQYDALITPGAPGPAPSLETTGNAIMQRPWTTMGIPTIGIPVGLAKNGLPLGIQIVGEPYGEAKMIAVAAWCEEALDVRLIPPI